MSGEKEVRIRLANQSEKENTKKMSKRDYSKHQQEVIGRYYQNLDAIMLQKLQELVTELYLTKNGPKEDRLWLRAEKAMVKLKTPKSIREHIMRKRQVEILARNVENWLKNVK